MFTYTYKAYTIGDDTYLKEIELEQENAVCVLMLDAKGQRIFKGYTSLKSAVSAQRYYLAKYDKQNTGASGIIYDLL